MADSNAERWVISQFREATAQRELQTLGPASFNWPKRVEGTLALLLPKLPGLATFLVTEIPRRLNSVSHIATALENGKQHVSKAAVHLPEILTWYNETVLLAGIARQSLGNLQSQQISAEIQRAIHEYHEFKMLLTSNGNSIYPDMLDKNLSYTGLLKQNKKIPIDGPCLNGKRPSNVPDGLEIKCNQGVRVKVDAHGAHPGLHLGITWDFNNSGEVNINGVWAAYVRIADHRESGRNVNVTTVKYSYGHELFKSLL